MTVPQLRRVLLLGWDGVVDLPRSGRDDLRHLEDADEHGDPVTVRWDAAVVAQLSAILADPSVDVFWLTTRGFLVPERLAPLVQLPRFASSPHATDLPGGPRYPPPPPHGWSWWKARATLLHLTEVDEVLWVDSQISEELHHAIDTAGRSAGLRCVVPNPAVGIDDVALAVIREWVRKPASPSERSGNALPDPRQSRTSEPFWWLTTTQVRHLGASAEREIEQAAADIAAGYHAACSTLLDAAVRLERTERGVRLAIDEGTMYAERFREGMLCPPWQFIGNSLLLPGLREIIAHLPHGLRGPTLDAWMTTPKPTLRIRNAQVSPVAWLEANRPVGAVLGLLDSAYDRSR
ncbi:hypothetical protein ACLUS2_009430 [Curtobacterium flaccumfaciens pv. flaccumfaciens]|uniref:hypothetical protein n=1 Tax=Curtobacterium flaccumfaciens TaxID=2035 RepID=UPI0039957D7D